MILCVFPGFGTKCVAKITIPAEKPVRFSDKSPGFFTIRNVIGNNNLVVIFLTANSRIITELPNLLSDSGLPGTPPLTQSGQAPQASGAPSQPAGQIPGRKNGGFFLPGAARRKNIGKNLAVNKFYAAKHWEIKAYE